jgi:hypothetical protein
MIVGSVISGMQNPDADPAALAAAIRRVMYDGIAAHPGP